MSSVVSAQYTSVTEMDGQTPHTKHIYRAMHMRRAVKINSNELISLKK